MPAKQTRLVSKNLLLIFSYCDQEEQIQLQQLSRACYNDYIPRTLANYVFERPYVHLFLANRKRFVICYLENMKAVEVPKPPDTSSEKSAIPPAEDSEEQEKEIIYEPRELTTRTGFKIPDRLQHFASVQFMHLILVAGGMQTYLEPS